jgi:hypothetical protein
VDPGTEFKAPSKEEIEKGLENLWTMEKGEWSEKNGGVELVWFNMPLPKVVTGEEAAAYEFLEDPVWESEEVQTAIETWVKLLMGAGVMVVVGPMGVPPLDLVAAGEVFSVEAGEQVDCDSGGGGKEDEGKGVLVFVLLFRIGLSRTDCRYVRVDEKFCFIAHSDVSNLQRRTDSRYTEECGKDAEKADSVIVSNNSAHRHCETL